jgi:hypothetical protein
MTTWVKEAVVTPGSILTRAKEAGVTSGSFLTRVKEAGMPASFIRALNAPDEPDSFGRRRLVLGTDGGNPMMMPLALGVLGIDEEKHEDDDTGPSILDPAQHLVPLRHCQPRVVARGDVVVDPGDAAWC